MDRHVKSPAPGGRKKKIKKVFVEKNHKRGNQRTRAENVREMRKLIKTKNRKGKKRKKKRTRKRKNKE